MKKLLIFTIILSFSSSLFSQSDEKITDIKAIIEANATSDLSVSVGKELIKQYRKRFLSAPEEFWLKLLNEFKESAEKRYYIPFYDKNFTEEEIIQLRFFYESSLGKKLSAALMQIDKDKALFEYEMKILMTALLYDRVDEKGYKEEVSNQNK